MQVDPIKPTMKAPGTKHLKLKYDTLLLISLKFAFNFNLRHYIEEEHRLFLLGLAKFGKGDWRSISRNFVISRTPTQAGSLHGVLTVCS